MNNYIPTTKAEKLRAIAETTILDKTQETVRPLYQEFMTDIERAAREGAFTYCREVNINESYESIRGLGNFKKDFPILKQMFEEEGFTVETNLFDEYSIRHFYIRVNW